MTKAYRGQAGAGFALVLAGLCLLGLIIGGIYWLTGWETVDPGNVGIVVNYREGTAICPGDKPNCTEGEKTRAAKITPHYPGSWFWVSPRVETFYKYPVSEQNAQAEANNRLIVAEADRQVAQKKAEAEATNTRITSEAEANRIKAINAALANSPQYLAWRAIEKWDGKQPSTVVFGDGANNTHILIPTP